MSEPIDPTIAALASRQQGNVAHWQLVDLHIGRKAIAHRRRHGGRAQAPRPHAGRTQNLTRLGRLWDLAVESKMNCLGTSAAFIASCMKAGVEPRSGRDLSALKSVGSTGSPLSPEGLRWIYDSLGAETWLFSTSGGTDVLTAFVGGVPTLPVYLGELQAQALGAAVGSWDPDGKPHVDEVGKLVIT